MFLQRLFNSKTQVHRALDVAALKQEAIAQNVANADTPGYRQKDVTFADYMEEASGRLEAARTHPGHLPAKGLPNSGKPLIIEETNAGAVRRDENEVSIEAEMARLSANGMWYQALASRAGFENLRKAIGGK